MHSISGALTNEEYNIVSNSRPVIAVSEHHRSGLFLCQPHYVEFVGPGAAIGRLTHDQHWQGIAIGALELVRLEKSFRKQQAFCQRIQWTKWIGEITRQDDSYKRAEELLSRLEAFFGSVTIWSLPPEILALLVGVLPETMVEVHYHYFCDFCDHGESFADSFQLNRRTQAMASPWHWIDLNCESWAQNQAAAYPQRLTVDAMTKSAKHPIESPLKFQVKARHNYDDRKLINLKPRQFAPQVPDRFVLNSKIPQLTWEEKWPVALGTKGGIAVEN